MAGIAIALYGATAYLLFLGSFLYAIGFVAGAPLPKTIDTGTAGPLSASLALDAVLLGLFAVQHSVMARPAFKRLWTRIVPHSVERSTYVICASSALILLFWQWRPIPVPVWKLTGATIALTLQVISGGGWLLVLLSTFALSHFELFGLKQVYVRLRGRTLPAPEFKAPLLFAVATTGYILIGIHLEERDLVTSFGDHYRRYRREVPMLLPSLRTRVATDPELAKLNPHL
jgi:methanethiol S-methyltransferase